MLSSKSTSQGTALVNGQVNQMSADLPAIFQAAVNVIRNLPAESKDAPFTPSDELKLKFYAFYKQATEGPNRTPKPAFYDIVGKYKWNAWNDLGNMSKEDAMMGYVNELKKIVETMALTQPVADFYDALGPFYEFVFPNENKNPTSENKAKNGHAIMLSDKPSSSSTPSISSTVKANGYVNGDVYSECESDGEEFSDTYDHIIGDNTSTSFTKAEDAVDEIISARGESELTPPRFGLGHSAMRHSQSSQTGDRYSADRRLQDMSSQGASASGGYPPLPPPSRSSIPEVNEQIAVAILRLQQSMEQVVQRLDSLETRLGCTLSTESRNSPARQASGWWPFESLSPATTLFLIAWPVLAHILMDRMRDRSRNK